MFATLSFSGSPLLAKSNRGFDVVIIDEAAQAVSPCTNNARNIDIKIGCLLSKLKIHLSWLVTRVDSCVLPYVC